MFIDTNAVMDDGTSNPSGSPSQTFAMRHVFENSGLSEESSNIAFCICGLPCAPNQQSCDSCEGKNSIHQEGEILKK